jgi:membrane protein DedA with SNARE-associated domain
MDGFLALLSTYGYAVLVLVLFLGASGVPLPVAVSLIAAGAASARHILQPGLAFTFALSALLLGDTALYLLGRSTGWWLLGILCRLATNPEACILHSAQAFYRRGRITLVLAKFLPGVGVLAPPLAGSMKMGLRQFLSLDLLAVSLYITAYGGVGYLSADLLAAAMRRLHALELGLKGLLILGVIAYLLYRARLFWKQSRLSVPRVEVQELARIIEAAKPRQVPIRDVRSHGYYDPGAVRIKGSRRVEPNNLLASLQDLPRGQVIYLYCT